MKHPRTLLMANRRSFLTGLSIAGAGLVSCNAEPPPAKQGKKVKFFYDEDPPIIIDDGGSLRVWARGLAVHSDFLESGSHRFNTVQVGQFDPNNQVSYLESFFGTLKIVIQFDGVEYTVLPTSTTSPSTGFQISGAGRFRPDPEDNPDSLKRDRYLVSSSSRMTDVTVYYGDGTKQRKIPGDPNLTTALMLSMFHAH